MKSALLLALAGLMIPTFSQANCASTLQAIAAKIQHNGVPRDGFTLRVAPKTTPASSQVVGHCEGGKPIVYQRKAKTAAQAVRAGAAS